MKMKISEALASQQALQQFGAGKFPIQTSITIANNSRLLNEVAKEFEERRNELIKKFGKVNEETGHSTVEPDKQKVFAAEINKLIVEEVDLTLKTVSIADLGSKFEVEPNILVNLEWMITMVGQKPTRRKRK